MRDGVKLFTVVLSPTNYNKPVPFLIERTPYGADFPLKEDSLLKTEWLPPYYKAMAKEGYILVSARVKCLTAASGVGGDELPVPCRFA